LALYPALCLVRVPAADVRERDLDTDTALDQLRDLLERAAELARRVLHARRRRVARGVRALQDLDRCERAIRRAAHHTARLRLVHARERLLERRVAAARHAETRQVLDRQRWMPAAQ